MAGGAAELGSATKAFDSTSYKGKVITCKAAVAWSPGEPLAIQVVQVDPPQKMEVRIKVLFTSICHTDLSAWLGENEAQRVFPRILGHEASGIVESVGEGVEGLEEGDHVVPVFNGECGDCAYCRRPGTNLCRRYRVDPFKAKMTADGQTRFSVAGRPVHHFLNTSTFSQYTVVDAGCVVKVDPAAALSKVCLLSCGVSTGVGAAWNTADVKEGSTVAVFGLGTVGLAVVQGARIRGASRIVGVDVNAEKFQKGKEMGVTDPLNPKDFQKPIHEVIRDMTGGGVDYSFECAGSINVLCEAFASTHDGWGVTVLLGVHSSPKLLPIHPMELFYGRRMIGSIFGDVKCKTHIPDMVRHFMNETLELDGFITHQLPFEEINTALRLLQDGVSLRCVLHL